MSAMAELRVRRMWEPTAPVFHKGADATGRVPDWLNSFSVESLREVCRAAGLQGIEMHPRKCVFARLVQRQFPDREIVEVSVCDRLWLKFQPTVGGPHWVTWGLPEPVRKFTVRFNQGLFPELIEQEAPKRGIELPPQTKPGELVGPRGPKEGQPARLFT